MASLVSVPVHQPYRSTDNQYAATSLPELASIFKPDENSFISNNDKLHNWAMWRTHVNESFIRNLPVQNRTTEPSIREKRIDIDRFLIHSDTDELKRSQMKEMYGTCYSYSSRLGHSTYFLYGIPRILIRAKSSGGKHRNIRPTVAVEPEPMPEPPKRRSHLFIGAAQQAKSLSQQEEMPVELSHAQKTTNVVTSKPPQTTALRGTIHQETNYMKTQIIPRQMEHTLWEETHLIKDQEDAISVHHFKWDDISKFDEDVLSHSSSIGYSRH